LEQRNNLLNWERFVLTVLILKPGGASRWASRLEHQCVVRAGLTLVVMLSVSSFILAEKDLSEPRQHGCDHDHGSDIGEITSDAKIKCSTFSPRIEFVRGCSTTASASDDSKDELFPELGHAPQIEAPEVFHKALLGALAEGRSQN
jgi:hypothetical protein